MPASPLRPQVYDQTWYEGALGQVQTPRRVTTRIHSGLRKLAQVQEVPRAVEGLLGGRRHVGETLQHSPVRSPETLECFS